MDIRTKKLAAITILTGAVLISASCAGNVQLCRSVDFRGDRFFSRSTPEESVRFVQYCIATEHWREFYDTLSKATRNKIPWIGFWLEIESIKWPETEIPVVEMLKNAEIWGEVPRKKDDPEYLSKVALAYRDVGGRMWMKLEDGRWRFALVEMVDYINEHGTLRD